MGRNSRISWTHASFNGWIGCEEVSPACDKCYARTLAERYGWAKWGKDTPRHRTTEAYWRRPLAWNAEAMKKGQRIRVFAFSLADWAEDRRDLDPWRADFFQLIEQTPYLDWLLLSKRADCMKRLLPATWVVNPRPNVWLGVTAENQRRAEERIPLLLKVPAVIRWVSAEPLLSAIDFSSWQGRISQVIVGGESGHGARRMDPEWARDILRQCREAGTAFFFKQTGEAIARELAYKDKAGKDASEWSADLRVQEFPTSAAGMAGATA